MDHEYPINIPIKSDSSEVEKSRAALQGLTADAKKAGQAVEEQSRAGTRARDSRGRFLPAGSQGVPPAPAAPPPTRVNSAGRPIDDRGRYVSAGPASPPPQPPRYGPTATTVVDASAGRFMQPDGPDYFERLGMGDDDSPRGGRRSRRPPRRIEGPARAAAQARLGLAGANIAQDAIQGGPASTINNILGMAGDSGIKALAADFIAAQGGAAGLAAKFGAVGLAAGAMFLVIDRGLKSAQLDWSDLDNVVGNLGPIRAAQEAFAGLGQTIVAAADAAGLDDAFDAIASGVNWIAQATIGWNDATDAAKAHKDEVERTNVALKEHEEALKRIEKIRSEAQDKTAERGEVVGNALADLGGEGGLEAVINKLAERRTAKGADDEIERGGVTKTRREWAGIDVGLDVDRAASGDRAALDRLRPQLKAAGYDIADVEAASRGVDARADRKAVEDDWDERIEADQKDSERRLEKRREDRRKRDEDAVRALQDGYTAARAAGASFDVRSRMRDLGIKGRPEEVQEKLEAEARRTFQERAAEDGTSIRQARADISRENAEKREADLSRRDAPARKVDDDAARTLQDWFNGAVANQRNVDVAAQMQAMGVAGRPEEVRKKLEAEAQRTFTERASASGVSVDQAFADFRQEEAEERRRGLTQEAERRLAGTGLDERSERRVIEAQYRAQLAGGGRPDQVVGQVAQAISRELVGTGMAKDRADEAGLALAQDQYDRVRDKIVGESMEPGETKAPRSLDALDVGNAIQQGQSPLLDPIKQMRDAIINIEKQGLMQPRTRGLA